MPALETQGLNRTENLLHKEHTEQVALDRVRPPAFTFTSHVHRKICYLISAHSIGNAVVSNQKLGFEQALDARPAAVQALEVNS
ncbi:hypothetical protein N7478_010284 [Penicillium angulare]|uniref:uncharacterized protein n=1 Tax=Penicillium angulare TaxID=116970 RepID=UPI0025403801|nr:uncharacterized protein N7478_010284 [Penicillium angulare]KAJ5267476.1 hypothetical protein N7478_010284 [Penicillium angulare]